MLRVPCSLLRVLDARLGAQSRNCHLKWAPDTKINREIWNRYKDLPLAGCKIMVSYVWIDGSGQNMRAKAKTMEFIPKTPDECPVWDFDGSSSQLAPVTQSDCVLRPIAIYPDPITQGDNKLVLCETYDAENKPTKSNFRHGCVNSLKQAEDQEPWFGFEQEYQLMDVTGRPFGWPVVGEPCHGAYHCAVGADKQVGREIVEAHFRCCLYADIGIFGTNAECNMGQWEFQTIPLMGVKASDDTWMARYLLWRIAEDYGVAVSIHPKLFPNWAGAGFHSNFSSKDMREEGGMKAIEAAMKPLEKNHQAHLKIYDCDGGLSNSLRLTGLNESSTMDKFTWGVANRSASVRITRGVARANKGYLEDRRPASNADPYRISEALVNTILLEGNKDCK